MIKTIRQFGWVYYLDEEKSKSLDSDRCGKWMYFFSDVKRAAELCMEAVEKGVVAESKHSDEPEGVCCFYLNGDDQDAHKSVLRFFLEHDLIRKTKKGKLYNISFKYDNQTRNGEYGDSFQAEIKLDQFLNLETGEWI